MIEVLATLFVEYLIGIPVAVLLDRWHRRDDYSDWPVTTLVALAWPIALVVVLMDRDEHD